MVSRAQWALIENNPEVAAISHLNDKPLGYYKSGDRQIAGPPPTDHPRRCQHIYVTGVRIGRRCKRWALKGATKCPRHHGRQEQRSITKHHGIAYPKRQFGKGIHVFYAKVLGKTLQDKLKEIVESPNHEQMNLREEIALAKISAADTVQLYDGVCALYETAPPEKRATLGEAKLQTGAVMRSVLGDVVDMCDKVTRVELAMKDKVTVQNIVIIVNQITKIAFDVFGVDNIEACYEFERRIKDQVRLPSDGPEGTTITPDQDVLEMDDTIPARPLLAGEANPSDEDESDDDVQDRVDDSGSADGSADDGG